MTGATCEARKRKSLLEYMVSFPFYSSIDAHVDISFVQILSFAYFYLEFGLRFSFFFHAKPRFCHMSNIMTRDLLVVETMFELRVSCFEGCSPL